MIIVIGHLFNVGSFMNNKQICTYCDKPVRSSYCFNPFVPHGYESVQCDRVWCRIWSGYYWKRSWLFRNTVMVRGLFRYRISIQCYQTKKQHHVLMRKINDSC